ncbi:hypothetical protein KHM83_16455 [Fusibacter paucivorans]|uniref:Uncharacterized protein n=1 Tax=Fusibacter paucivorans TaxID=76009 RepID=A0ABS5PTN8_9FIRM|nr:hypothetical protein [Fusibacter paucivorans]MBS7528282.1 hypothetical protein [Fusibacter paucivorans]
MASTLNEGHQEFKIPTSEVILERIDGWELELKYFSKEELQTFLNNFYEVIKVILSEFQSHKQYLVVKVDRVNRSKSNLIQNRVFDALEKENEMYLEQARNMFEPFQELETSNVLPVSIKQYLYREQWQLIDWMQHEIEQIMISK